MKQIIRSLILTSSLCSLLLADEMSFTELKDLPSSVILSLDSFLDIANGRKPDDLSVFYESKGEGLTWIGGRTSIPRDYPKKYRVQQTPEDTLETKAVYVLKGSFLVQVIDKKSSKIRYDSPVILWKIVDDTIFLVSELKSMEEAVRSIGNK